MYSLISIIAATSRMLWAFAREKGVPFSGWVSQVRLQCTLLKHIH